MGGGAGVFVKKVDLSSTQGALCTVSVFFILHFTYLGRGECVRTQRTPAAYGPVNGPFSGTTQVSRYQKGKTSLDFTEESDSEWQWHQLGRIQVCT